MSLGATGINDSSIRILNILIKLVYNNNNKLYMCYIEITMYNIMINNNCEINCYLRVLLNYCNSTYYIFLMV